MSTVERGAWARWSGLIVIGAMLVGAAHGCGDEVASFEGTGGTTTTSGVGGSGGEAGEGGMAGGGGSGGSVTPPACQPPASVPDPWVVTFQPYELGTGQIIQDVLVQIHAADGTVLESATSGPTGQATLTVATGGAPIDGYFTAAKAGYLTTRFRIQGGLGWFPGWMPVQISNGLDASPSRGHHIFEPPW